MRNKAGLFDKNKGLIYRMMVGINEYRKTFVVKKGRRFSAFRKSFVEMGRIYIPLYSRYIVSYFVQQRHFTTVSSIQHLFRIAIWHCKVLDPDLTLEKKTVLRIRILCFWYGSGSFYHEAKIVRKPLIPTVL